MAHYQHKTKPSLDMDNKLLPTTKRINGSLLPHHNGQVVRLIGTVVASADGSPGYQLDTGAGAAVRIQTQGLAGMEGVMTPGKFAAVLGRVNDDYTVTAFSATTINDGFDLPLHNQLLQVEHSAMLGAIF